MYEKNRKISKIDRLIISISARNVNEKCPYFVKGNDFYQRYCYNPELIQRYKKNCDKVLLGCCK